MKLPNKEKLIREFIKKYNKSPSVSELEQFSYWYKDFKTKGNIRAVDLIRLSGV